MNTASVTPAVDDRPQYHLTYSNGWMNDPLGLTYRDGRYHLFFQCVPGSRDWQPNCHWGHAVSEDLLTWSERDIALFPGDGDDGAWSGCVTDIGGETHMFYTSVTLPRFGIGRVREAKPADETWDTWTKQAGTVVAAPEHLNVIAFRDPFVFWDRSSDCWRMLVGASLQEHDGQPAAAAILSFISDGGQDWGWDSIVASRSAADTDPLWTGSLWECPQVIEIAGRQILMASVWHDDTLNYVIYQEGVWIAGRFEPSGPWRRLSYGESIYAPSTFTDAAGRTCLISWLRGVEGESWVGAQSLPAQLKWEDGQLLAHPHPNAVAAGLTQDIATGARINGPGWSLSRTNDKVTIQVGDHLEMLDCGDKSASYAVDGPILEVWCQGGLAAFAIPT